ncbi:MAG: threonine ammonia-lyase [Candidatus Methylarchaceae archaeon HK02M1]|nr:threonine ammonia-lyase [Candidatus Methylarchaceae archaeon HK01M]MCP8312487.1 threonine ammonia-lyase [Candidatus Methylarchaceae archaeon HK02M1]
MIQSRTFSEYTKGEVFLKLENLQKTGSFKIRGAYYKIKKLLYETKKSGVIEDFKKKGVVAASAGNHAQGVAYAAMLSGVKSKIVMPVWVTSSKYLATKAYKGEVILKNKIGEPIEKMDAAIKEAQRISEDDGAVYIHPFNDKDVIAGQGTIGLEIVSQLKEEGIKPDAVVVPVGGGGLISGISIALKRILGNSVKVYGVESDQFPCMLKARESKITSEGIRAGVRFPMESGTTIADGIAVESPGDLTHEIVNERRFVDELVVVSDDEIAMAMFHLLERSKTLVEGAGAASLAAILSRKINVKGKKVVAVISGGNVNPFILSRIVRRELTRDGRLVRICGRIWDIPGELNRVISIIASHGTNIVDIKCERYDPNIAPKDVEVEIALEILEKGIVESILKDLKERNFRFRELHLRPC